MDTFWTVDAFAKIKFGSVELKTDWKKQKDNELNWWEELLVKIYLVLSFNLLLDPNECSDRDKENTYSSIWLRRR